MFEIVRERTKEIVDNYIIVTYRVQSTKNVFKAAWDIALGQSVGNPDVRNEWETDELFEKHSCLIIVPQKYDFKWSHTSIYPHKSPIDIYQNHIKSSHDEIIEIAFPIVNIDWQNDGIAQLMCHIMGGQMDIDHIVRCECLDIHIPEYIKKVEFLPPRYGLKGMRKLVNQFDKPLLGGIVKPKTGLTPTQLLDMTKKMVDGGIDFIKEDEIMANPDVCRLQDRVKLIANFQQKSSKKFVYCFCINGDPDVIKDRVKIVSDEGGNGVHINIWSGFGAYNTIRKLDYPLYIHYQKSGDKVITNSKNPYRISWLVLCKLAALCGVDTIHAGMVGGYLNDSPEELNQVLKVLRESNVVPALSCGMHPGLIEHVNKTVGVDYLANVGGAIHGHPEGTEAGVKAMRQAIDRTYGHEYGVAVNKWGIHNEQL